jgi:hypothetical protein
MAAMGFKAPILLGYKPDPLMGIQLTFFRTAPPSMDKMAIPSWESSWDFSKYLWIDDNPNMKNHSEKT